MTWINWTDRLRESIAEEIDLDNPWVDRYRVPVTTDLYAHHAYIATLVHVPAGQPSLWDFQPVTEADAELVGRYIAFRKLSLRAAYLREVEAWRVDVDPGVNTVSIAKRPQGWVYRRATWQGQPFWPGYDNKIQHDNLRDLLDKVVSFGDEPNPQWVAFMEMEPVLQTGN